MKSNRLGDWLQFARASLANTSETAVLDVLGITSKVLSLPREALIAHSEFQIDPPHLEMLQCNLQRLLNGEPLPYVLGEWEFYGRTFVVNKDVLIPRPETELLVESALEWLATRSERSRVADVGAGSGCIGLSVVMEHPNISLIAVDVSWKALAVARRNVQRYAAGNQVDLVQGDLLSPFAGSFDLICANLPYIPSGRLESLAVTSHEPLNALDGGEDGLSWIRELVRQAQYRLARGGLMLLEMDASHSDDLKQFVSRHINGKIDEIKDYQGLPRIMRVERGMSS